jgi:hypothetical protein
MVYRILKRKEFEPEVLRQMASVFEGICRELGHAQTNESLRDLVAGAIIKCVQDGERDPERIRVCARAIIWR